MAMGFIKAQRDKSLWNALEHDDWAGKGGVQGQHYYQGLFRLEPGQVLLLETDLTLSSIGYKIGFSAPAAFTRSAIRWFGMTPSEFREKHKKAL